MTHPLQQPEQPPPNIDNVEPTKLSLKENEETTTTKTRYIFPNAPHNQKPPSILSHSRSPRLPPQFSPTMTFDSTPESHIIPFGPIFYPSAEEFKDPMKFISSIRSIAEPYGICKIVAPHADVRLTNRPIQNKQKRKSRNDDDDDDSSNDDDDENDENDSDDNSVVMHGGHYRVDGLSDLGIQEQSFHFKTKIQQIDQLLYRYGNNTMNANHNGMMVVGATQQQDEKSDSMYHASDSTSSNSSSTSGRRRKRSSLNNDDASSSSPQKRTKISTPDSKHETAKNASHISPKQVIQAGNQTKDTEDNEMDNGSNFGFDRSKGTISIKQFQKMAHAFKRQFFSDRVQQLQQQTSKQHSSGASFFYCGLRNRKRELPRLQLRKLARKAGILRVSSVTYFDHWRDVNDHDVEAEYWKIVEHKRATTTSNTSATKSHVAVQYGSDLINMPIQNNSCFPRHCVSDWALTKLPIVDNSVLKYLYMNVPGITSPMIYVGMLFSSFCWHVEDHYLYAINYLHYGAKKTWYCIPGSAAQKFEKFMRDRFPSLFQLNPRLLECLITMVSPSLLREHDIPVYRMIHEPGTFIVTFPRAYHAGFNHGFNLAESTNFAPGDWLPWGHLCYERYYSRSRPSAFSQDQMILTILQQGMTHFNTNTQQVVTQGCIDALEKELVLRQSLLQTKQVAKTFDMPNTKKNPHLSRRAAMRDNMVCCLCHQDCYMSAVICCACFDRSKRVAAKSDHAFVSPVTNFRRATMAGEEEVEEDGSSGVSAQPTNFLCLRCALDRSEEAQTASMCTHKNRDKLCLLIRFTEERLQELLAHARNPKEPLPTSPANGRRRSGGRSKK